MKKILISLTLGAFAVITVFLYGKFHLKKSDYIQQNYNKCEMVVDKENIVSNHIILHIKNLSNESLYCDFEYRIEKYLNKSWYIFEKNRYTEALGIVIPEYDTYEFEIKRKHPLRPGKYRIIKTISTSEGEYALFAEFEIEWTL